MQLFFLGVVVFVLYPSYYCHVVVAMNLRYDSIIFVNNFIKVFLIFYHYNCRICLLFWCFKGLNN